MGAAENITDIRACFISGVSNCSMEAFPNVDFTFKKGFLVLYTHPKISTLVNKNQQKKQLIKLVALMVLLNALVPGS